MTDSPFGPRDIAAMRQQLQAASATLRSDYEAHGNPKALLQGRCKLVDGTLAQLWQACELPPCATLVAVGGYGRGELYPYSDVDILILLAEEEPGADDQQKIERFIGALWDLGLDIGHSVRSLNACMEEAANDVTVQTNLLESRHLTGSETLYRGFLQRLYSEFNPEAFYIAKVAEQEQRYNRFNHTPYSLEPNCKESPGGLRDLQIIIWLSLAVGMGSSWGNLAKHGLITRTEASQLRSAERFLQTLRIRLHYLAKRREDRVIFDLQEALAKSFGLSPLPGKRAAERIMQRYYRVAKQITQLNTLLVHSLGQRYAPAPRYLAQLLDHDFQITGEQLDIVDTAVYERNPGAILKTYLHLQDRPELKGMSARTLRALWAARRLIDADFRTNPQNRQNFLAILQHERGQTHALRRMNQYDTLGAYIPAFGRIVGQMQHDLFHVYTVDQHILNVVRNVRRFALEEHAHEYPLMTRLMSEFERPWILYLAALFHDIAKGRGGDHSQLGRADARRFCKQHALDAQDVELVVWLVAQHLTMSQVAQKQDLTDPDVIRNFARLASNERRLTALYLLTHADIRGTSPKVWNGWKGKLLEDLFLGARQVLRGNTPQQALGLDERQQQIRERLRFHGLSDGVENALWKTLDTVYFLRHDVEEIAWHTRMLWHCPDSATPIVKARPSLVEKGLQVMVYAPDQKDLFMRLCASFSRLGYSIWDAKIHTTQAGYALDSFFIIDPNAEPDSDYRDGIALLESELTERLQQNKPEAASNGGRLSRQIKHFPITPSVHLMPDERGQHYLLSIVAADRPGLLYHIARTLTEHEVNLHTAKIVTLGERAEDSFLVSGQHLTNSSKLVQLEAALIERLQI